MSAVALPAVRGAFGTRATDHPPTTAVMTHTTASDVIDDDAIPLSKALYARANALDDATRLVTTNHSPVCLGTGSPIAGPVDGAQIAPAERRRLHAHQHLSMSRLWNGKLALCKSPIPQKNDSVHSCHTLYIPF